MPGKVHNHLVNLLPSISSTLFGTTCCYTDPSNRWGRGEHPDGLGLFEDGRQGAWEYDAELNPELVDVKLGDTIVYEVKATRGDFQADTKKKHRRPDTLAVGNYRVYVCPTGLIQPHEVPEYFGLVWVDESDAPLTVKWPPRIHNTLIGATTVLIHRAAKTTQPRTGSSGRSRGKLSTAAQDEPLMVHVTHEWTDAKTIASLASKPGVRTKTHSVIAVLGNRDDVESRMDGPVTQFKLKGIA